MGGLKQFLTATILYACGAGGLVVKHAPTFHPNLLTRRIVMVNRANAYTMGWKAEMRPPSPNRNVDDRRCASSFAVSLVALALWATIPAPTLAENLPGTAPGCTSTTNPSGYTIVSCDRQGLDRNGRLLGCSSSENCISTSAISNPGKFGSPWEYPGQISDADRAFGLLLKVVENVSGVTMKTVDTDKRYLLAQFPSKVPPGGVDYVEFLLKSQDRFVLYRSVSRDTLFVYPLQQPVSDQGKIKERLEGIRQTLGWETFVYAGE